MSASLTERTIAAEQRDHEQEQDHDPREAHATERAANRVRWIKIVCAIALSVCFWFSVPYRPLMQGPEDLARATAYAAETNDGALSRQIALPIIAAIGAYMLWRLPRRGRFEGQLRTLLLLFVGWAALSAVWSESPSTTLKRLVVFGLDAFFAFALARTLSVLEMALWGFITTGSVALLALYVDAVRQRIFAPFDPDYRFAGVMQPNYQAMNLVVCILCGLTLLQNARRPLAGAMRLVAPLTGAALLLLYLTRSRLSAALCVALAVFMLTRLARDRATPAGRAMMVVGAMAILVPAAIYFVGQNGGGAAQSVFMMGRQDVENTSSLSNRAPLWAELVQSVEDRPVLGFGYGAFWTPERLRQVSFDQGWIVPHAHNTYLDEALSLGMVGVLLYMAALWTGCAIAWKRYRAEPSSTTLLPAMLLTWLALSGLAESVPLDPYLPTMLAYACLVKMCFAQGSEAEIDAGARSR